MVNNDITIIGVHHLCFYCRCLVAPRVTPLLTLRNSYRLKQDVNRYGSFLFSLAYEDSFGEELCAPYRLISKKVLEPHQLILMSHGQIALLVPLCLFLCHLFWKKSEGIWRHGSFKSSPLICFFFFFFFSLLDLVRTHVKGIPLFFIDFVDWLGAK